MNYKAHALGKKLKDTVKGAGSVVAIPFRNRSAAKANRDADTLIRARKFDKMPNFANGAPTEAFKARALADEVRMRRKK